jgi:hypothetical protein
MGLKLDSLESLLSFSLPRRRPLRPESLSRLSRLLDLLRRPLRLGSLYRLSRLLDLFRRPLRSGSLPRPSRLLDFLRRCPRRLRRRSLSSSLSWLSLPLEFRWCLPLCSFRPIRRRRGLLSLSLLGELAELTDLDLERLWPRARLDGRPPGRSRPLPYFVLPPVRTESELPSESSGDLLPFGYDATFLLAGSSFARTAVLLESQKFASSSFASHVSTPSSDKLGSKRVIDRP